MSLKTLICAFCVICGLLATATAQQQRPVRGSSFKGFDGEIDGNAEPPAEPLSLWYRQPASVWTEALPVGNGRLGAMVFGGISRERLQLNEDTLWAGRPYDPNNPEALAALPEVRRRIFAGKYAEAHKLIGEKMMAKPLKQMPYQTVGDLQLTFPRFALATDYRRDLNLDTGVTSVSFTAEGVRYTREVFVSAVDQVIVIRLTCDKPGGLTFVADMSTPQNAKIDFEIPGTIVMRGVGGDAQGVKGVLNYQARVKVVAEGGKMETLHTAVVVGQANSATIFISMATSYKNYHDTSGDPEAITKKRIAATFKKSYKKLKEAHIREHQRLFRRASLDLGTTSASRLPTDERIANFASSNDPQLAALYFQYGRYLLISSSRPGSQPANLQGIWNEWTTPPWDSKWTININTEMNYWPVDSTNLSELIEPLKRMVLELQDPGSRTARATYGARGWVVHHNTDIWRATAPIDGPQYGMWPMGGAWLCQNLWDHYEFTGDRKFLKEIYPALKGASLFFLDTLVEEPTHHWLITVPSLSPENRHPFGTSVVAGPAMDSQLLRDLFANTSRAAELLDVDKELRVQLLATRGRLAPDQIGKAGQLQEWMEDWDMQAPDREHRHVSHLYALHPSNQITPRGTPELAAAVRKTLEVRGDESTGWATAWRLNLWARLLDAEHAYKILTILITPERTYPNMFDAHPPFQIDGNFGGTAGIAEMLLQSHTGEIELLPALPKAWPNGSVRGLLARGGFSIDMSWKDGRLVNAYVRSLSGNPAVLRYGNVTKKLALKRGGVYLYRGAAE